MKNNFSAWPEYDAEQVAAVTSVLHSGKVNYWTGNEGRQFEKEFSEWSGSQYAVAVCNGTVALDLAWIALDISCGDEIIVTSRTFLASVSSIVNAGATPVFVDVSEESQNIAPELIQAAITSSTKAILAVHLAGWPCDMDSIMAIAKNHGLSVVEDCAQAHGAKYKGKSVGSIGHVGAWSFCQDKIMTTGGEGGMVTTNDKKIWSTMWSYKDHGKSWDSVYDREHPAGFKWLHNSFGTNWRMTEMQAAIGRIQLKRMPEWHRVRSAYAQSILGRCRQFDAFRVPGIPDYIEHAWYKCYVFINSKNLNEGWDRDRVMIEINSLSVPCYSGTCSEVYLEKAFDKTDLRPKERLPVAKELGETSLMFLVHPTLTDLEIQKTCDVIHNVLTQASV